MFSIKNAIKKTLPQPAEQDPNQDQNQNQTNPDRSIPEQNPIKLIWIILGVAAIILMWLISSWLF